MKIPKVISKNGREYMFVKQCNKNLFLYRERIYGYNECFNRYDLGLIERQPKMSYGQLRYIS